MKKSLLIYACAFAALVSCSKYGLDEAADTDAKVETVTVSASFPDGTGEGMKSAFTGKDFLRVRYTDASGNQVGRTQVLDNTTGEGKNVTFSGKVAVPNKAQNMLVYVDNHEYCAINYASHPTVCSLSDQKGTLADAVAHQVIMGTAAVSSNATVNLSYKTTIIKADVSYPEGVVPVEGETTVSFDCGQKNLISFDDAALSTNGVCSAAAVVDTVSKKACAYLSVWAEGLSNGMLTSFIKSTKYGCDYDVDQVKAGKTVVAQKELATLLFNYFIPDEEYKVTGVRGNIVEADPCITLAGGVLTVSENTTGKIRTSTAVLDNGKTYIFKQLGANEFKGTYSFNTKGFFKNNSIWATDKGFNVDNYNSATFDVTFGAPLLGETLKDIDSVAYTNQIGIKGFFGDAIADATIDINYATGKVRLGILLDARKAQKTTLSNKEGYGYVAFLPGLATGSGSNWGSPYNFIQADLDSDSAKDFVYLWFDCDEDLKVFSWNCFYKAQTVERDKKTSINRIVAISCCLFKAEDATAANVNSAYSIVFQANVNNTTTIPMTFTRK